MLENNNYSDPDISQREEAPSSDKLVSQYQKLLDVFPDAEPDYLWEQCVSMADDGEGMQNFIEDALEHRNYPKQKVNNLRRNSQQIETQFQKILQKYPDVDPQYLWAQCELKAMDEEAMRVFIIETMLRGNYPKVSNRETENRNHAIDIAYQKLLEIFPDADPEYLWEQCETRVNNPALMEEFIQSNSEHHNYPKHPDFVAPKSDIEGVDDSLQEIVGVQYRNLLEVFPNADPSYLLEKVKSMAGDENALQEFISDALENESYPTMEHHLQTQQANDLRKKYLEEFYAEEFMGIFPDPWNYFLKEKPGNKEPCPLAVEYLQRRYLEYCSKFLDDIYKKNKYSLARTCKELDADYPKKREIDPNVLFGFSELTVPFVQEVAFVEYEPRIKEYLEFKKMVREKALIRARKAGTLLECACCYNDELLPDDVTTCSSGHIFCVECVTRGAETIIGDGKILFPCYLGDKCTGEFSLLTLQMVLKPTIFSNLLLRKQMIEVTEAGVSDIETCPFCDFVAMKPTDDDVKIFTCRNPQCMTDSCRACREPSHIPYRCNEMEKPEEVRMRTYIEDKMTQALVRECWKCKRKFVKYDGCNKMTCQCGALMCYICRQPVRDYNHFDQNGNRNSGRCPLWSNNEELHVGAVMNEGRRARDHVLTTNPEFLLKNDPTLIPPK